MKYFPFQSIHVWSMPLGMMPWLNEYYPIENITGAWSLTFLAKNCRKGNRRYSVILKMFATIPLFYALKVLDTVKFKVAGTFLECQGYQCFICIKNWNPIPCLTVPGCFSLPSLPFFPSWIIMAEGEELWYSIYKARDEKMVSKDGIHTLRIASFLNPLAQVSTKLLRFLTFHCCLKFLREQPEMAIRCSVERLEHAPETMGRMVGLPNKRSRFHFEPKCYMWCHNQFKANSSPSVQTIRQQNSYLSSARNLKNSSVRPRAVALLSQSLLQMQTANRVKKMTFQFHWL